VSDPIFDTSGNIQVNKPTMGYQILLIVCSLLRWTWFFGYFLTFLLIEGHVSYGFSDHVHFYFNSIRTFWRGFLHPNHWKIPKLI